MQSKSSIVLSFRWLGYTLLGIGLLFACIALMMQMIPIEPSDLVLSQRIATLQDVKWFRLIFLFAFGSVGLLCVIASLIVFYRNAKRVKQLLYLKEHGVRLEATIDKVIPRGVSVNKRATHTLYASYLTNDKQTLLFQSPMLRLDPRPSYVSNKVVVYCDMENPKLYAMDILESFTLFEH